MFVDHGLPGGGVLPALHGGGEVVARHDNNPMAAVGDFSRFESPDRLVAYFGLNPKVRQSGDAHVVLGRITKAGPAQARGMLVEAAFAASRAPIPCPRAPQQNGVDQNLRRLVRSSGPGGPTPLARFGLAAVRPAAVATSDDPDASAGPSSRDPPNRHLSASRAARRTAPFRFSGREFGAKQANEVCHHQLV